MKSMDRKQLDQFNPLNKKQSHRPYIFVRIEQELKAELEKAARQHTKNRGKKITANKLILNYIIEGLKHDAAYKKSA